MTAPSPGPAPRDVAPLRRERAVLGSGPDAAVPAHYGALLREQRRLESGRSVVDLGQMEVLEVSGADARSWLTTVSTQDVSALPVGASAAIAVLSPQGRLEHLAALVSAGPEQLVLITDPGTRAGWRRYLEMMRFAARVELTDRDDLRALGSTQPIEATAAARELGIASPEFVHVEAWPEVAPGGVAYGPDPEDPVRWFTSLLPAASLEGLPWAEEHLAGMLAAEALRVASHRPRLVTEADERTIPHELDLLRTAVHTEKGCYRGQETVAKVLNLGQPPRRLVMLHLDGSQDLPAEAGAEVRLGGPEGKVVGRIATAVMHADLGPLALAVVKRAVPLDATLHVAVGIGEGDERTELWLDASQEVIVRERDHGQRPPTARL